MCTPTASDHGFHLGQFRIPQGKVTPYETDIRVPFFARGPGIVPGTHLRQMIANIDVAPTILDLAGLTVPNLMDGRSFAPLLKAGPGIVDNAVLGLQRPWRTHYLIQHNDASVREWGDVSTWDTDARFTADLIIPGPWGPGCAKVKKTCTNIGGHGLAAGCPCQQGGVLPANPCSTSAPNGTSAEACPRQQRFDYLFTDPSYNWRALRVINSTHNFTFVQFDPEHVFDNISFSEFYDLTADEWQMKNLWPSLPAGTRTALQVEMETYFKCSGTRTTPSTCE